jgi:hypothetical protein|tara:strand:- start:2 stop:538 length:537 start_codon:yes stop_codon:yes gene_type:complete
MAEAFSNKVARAAGIVTSMTGGAIGITTNLITGISTTNVAANDLVDNGNFILGTKVSSVGASQVICDRDSTNTAAATAQNVKFLGVTTAYASTGVKSILVGGTFANNTGNSVNLTVQVYDNSVTTEVALAAKIPVPNGSSFVISDTGKTVLEASDEIRIYCDSENAIDATLSILTGVS